MGVISRGVRENGSSYGNGTPVGFPRQWELDLNKDGNWNWNGNTTRWEWERLMLVGSQNPSRGLVISSTVRLKLRNELKSQHLPADYSIH